MLMSIEELADLRDVRYEEVMNEIDIECPFTYVLQFSAYESC